MYASETPDCVEKGLDTALNTCRGPETLEVIRAQSVSSFLLPLGLKKSECLSL